MQKTGYTYPYLFYHIKLQFSNKIRGLPAVLAFSMKPPESPILRHFYARSSVILVSRQTHSTWHELKGSTSFPFPVQNLCRAICLSKICVERPYYRFSSFAETYQSDLLPDRLSDRTGICYSTWNYKTSIFKAIPIKITT